MCCLLLSLAGADKLVSNCRIRLEFQISLCFNATVAPSVSLDFLKLRAQGCRCGPRAGEPLVVSTETLPTRQNQQYGPSALLPP